MLAGCATHETTTTTTTANPARRTYSSGELKKTGQLDTPRVPVELQAERILDLDHATTREARRRVHVPRVGGDAVDIFAGETGVGDGIQAGVQGEPEGRSVEAPPDVGLTDAADDGAALSDRRAA